MFFPSVGVATTDLTHTWSKAAVGIPAFFVEYVDEGSLSAFDSIRKTRQIVALSLLTQSAGGQAARVAVEKS